MTGFAIVDGLLKLSSTKEVVVIVDGERAFGHGLLMVENRPPFCDRNPQPSKYPYLFFRNLSKLSGLAAPVSANRRALASMVASIGTFGFVFRSKFGLHIKNRIRVR